VHEYHHSTHGLMSEDVVLAIYARHCGDIELDHPGGDGKSQHGHPMPEDPRHGECPEDQVAEELVKESPQRPVPCARFRHAAECMGDAWLINLQPRVVSKVAERTVGLAEVARATSTVEPTDQAEAKGRDDQTDPEAGTIRSNLCQRYRPRLLRSALPAIRNPLIPKNPYTARVPRVVFPQISSLA
jgi:hypothetical protein